VCGPLFVWVSRGPNSHQIGRIFSCAFVLWPLVDSARCFAAPDSSSRHDCTTFLPLCLYPFPFSALLLHELLKVLRSGSLVPHSTRLLWVILGMTSGSPIQYLTSGNGRGTHLWNGKDVLSLLSLGDQRYRYIIPLPIPGGGCWVYRVTSPFFLFISFAREFQGCPIGVRFCDSCCWASFGKFWSREKSG
jgi:hypothetical protein